MRPHMRLARPERADHPCSSPRVGHRQVRLVADAKPELRRSVSWSDSDDDVTYVAPVASCGDVAALKKAPAPARPPLTAHGEAWQNGMRVRTRCWTALDDKTEVPPGRPGRVAKVLPDGLLLVTFDADDMATSPVQRIIAEPRDLQCEGYLRPETVVSVADLMVRREGMELRISRGSKGQILSFVPERCMYVLYLEAHATSVLVAAHNVQPLVNEWPRMASPRAPVGSGRDASVAPSPRAPTRAVPPPPAAAAPSPRGMCTLLMRKHALGGARSRHTPSPPVSPDSSKESLTGYTHAGSLSPPTPTSPLQLTMPAGMFL